MKPGALILVLLVENKPEGFVFHRVRNEWPLHITLAPWFYTDEAALVQALGNQLTNTNALTVTVSKEVQFNPITHVNLLQDQTVVQKLHNIVLDILTAQHAQFARTNQPWIRSGYKAHITHHADNRSYEGDIINVNAVTLVRYLSDNRCMVVKHLPLGVERSKLTI